MGNIINEIRKTLYDCAEESYRDFNRSLIPGDIAPILGVRIPKLRKIAKKAAKENGREYLGALLKEERGGHVFYEELLLHGMIIGYLKCERKEREKLLNEFVPVIDNWSVCDSSCITYKFMKTDMEEWFDYLLRYVNDEREYAVRFAVVCMLNYFITETFVDRVVDILEKLQHEGYYVKMAVAWALSVCYVKFPKKMKLFFKNNELDDFTCNKAIQKIRDSLQVSREEKEMLKGLMR